MHKEILTDTQIALLPLIRKFKSDFGLVGGTAIALHIGHRESIDFDLFNYREFENGKIRRVFSLAGKSISAAIRDEIGQFTFAVDGVQITFFHYPYSIEYPEDLDDSVRMPTLLTLAAMKAFALGRRAKWKDYVDLYFIMRDHHPFAEIARHAEELFGLEFNAKLFREQISYFEDISYSEPVIFKPGFEVPDEEVKRALSEYSLA